MRFQRAAGGGIAVPSGSLNGLSREPPGTKPVINEGCMLVHRKWTVGQFEWHRDYNWIITVSSVLLGAVFCVCG